MRSRTVAALILARLFRKKLSLTTLIPEYNKRLSSQRDQALTQELCYGVLRWYFQLDYILKQLLKKNLRQKDMDIRALLFIGIYQLKYLSIPDHAAISATVDSCYELKKPWATSLVNAVLRSYQRGAIIIEASVNRKLGARYAHPDWLINMLKSEYSISWRDILDANNQRPPMFLRVNVKLAKRATYCSTLADNNIRSTVTEYSPAGIKLANPIDVGFLPGFNKGLVSVQDLAAQLCISILDLKDDLRILDACAAPGGKLAHILEQPFNYTSVVAIEKDESRYIRMRQNLSRLKLSAKLILGNAKDIHNWWDGEMFDRILLDVPCSATGVIRRHPDIKYSRQKEDIDNLVNIQNELLKALWSILKTGGKLIYATCSILRQENDSQIEKFIKQHNDAVSICIESDWGLLTKYGKQIITGENDMDGFYYACLHKLPKSQ